MCNGFSQIVEEIKNLPLEAKEELKTLLEKYLVEERRAEIHKNYRKTKKDLERGKLTFSNNIDELKRLV